MSQRPTVESAEEFAASLRRMAHDSLTVQRRDAEGAIRMRDAAIRAERDKYWLALTRKLEEHPEGWNGPCACQECVSYDGEPAL